MEYSYKIEQTEYSPEKKREYWQTAIGLNKVDGLTPSNYLISQAEKNINGEISNSEVYHNIKTYYESCDGQHREKECDIVSIRIKELLETESFKFSPATLISIHRYLFQDIYPEIAGKVRNMNITKSESILGGATVRYASVNEIQDNMTYDFTQEENYRYRLPLNEKDILHLSKFTSSIWQTHEFWEGNTRTTAVFIEKYLRSMGIAVNNEPFAYNAEYFRNALVRSNYRDASKNIMETYVYLERFFSNLLKGTEYPLDTEQLDTQKYQQQNVEIKKTDMDFS